MCPCPEPVSPSSKITRPKLKMLGPLCNQTINLKTDSKTQGHPTSIFRKYLFGRQFEIWNFRNICCKINCLPASPRIFEHLKNGIITRFEQIFTLKMSPRIFGSLFFCMAEIFEKVSFDPYNFRIT